MSQREPDKIDMISFKVANIDLPWGVMPFILFMIGSHLHNKTESATEIEAKSGNYLQLFLYRSPKKNYDAYAAAAEHNSKITLSLNDYTNSVSKLILLNLLGAASLTIEPMDFLHHVLLQRSVHGISDPPQNNRLC
jgi:hypothetical protein